MAAGVTSSKEEDWEPELRPLLGSKSKGQEKEAGKVVRGQSEVKGPDGIYRRQSEQREEDIKINNRENFLELEGRKVQTEKAAGNLARETQVTHTKVIFMNGQNTGQKEGPRNFQEKSNYARKRE